MKKKNYIIPETEVLNVAVQTIIATSGLTVNPDDSEGISDENDVLSRKHFNVWGDED